MSLPSGRLVAYVHPLGLGPAFLVPIFHRGEGYLIQEMNDNGMISGWQEVNLHGTTIQVSERIERQVGSAGLFAFTDGDGFVWRGTRSELSKELESVLHRFDDRPFVKRGILDFLGRSEEADGLTGMSYSELAEYDRSAAAQWLLMNQELTAAEPLGVGVKGFGSVSIKSFVTHHDKMVEDAVVDRTRSGQAARRLRETLVEAFAIVGPLGGAAENAYCNVITSDNQEFMRAVLALSASSARANVVAFNIHLSGKVKERELFYSSMLRGAELGVAEIIAKEVIPLDELDQVYITLGLGVSASRDQGESGYKWESHSAALPRKYARFYDLFARRRQMEVKVGSRVSDAQSEDLVVNVKDATYDAIVGAVNGFSPIGGMEESGEVDTSRLGPSRH